MVSVIKRVFCGASGLFGAAGVAAYAAAAHIDSNFDSIAPVLLCHAPALLALALLPHKWVLGNLAGALIIIGASLFSIDIFIRYWANHGLFPYAAPLGGMTIMLGWILFFIGALLPSEEPDCSNG